LARCHHLIATGVDLRRLIVWTRLRSATATATATASGNHQ
jgi:hypothetical protein